MENDTFPKDFASIFNDEGNSSFSWIGDDLSVSSSDTPVSQCSPDVAQFTPSTQSDEAEDSTETTSEKKSDSENKEGKVGYYQYRDFSTMADPDPHVPVTKNGRIPSFPAKMYAILSRPDLQDIVSWMPHGRSWKVHKPREFEVKVIPAYFEHSKFSSFIRQANGWGFRRMISKGPDRNSYYHELFLRGKPFLLKMMKRPTTNKKPMGESDTEPDFYKIAQEKPLPEEKSDQEWEGLIKSQNNVQQPPIAANNGYQFPLASTTFQFPVAAMEQPKQMFEQQPASPVASAHVSNCYTQSLSSGFHAVEPTIIMPSQVTSVPQMQQSMPTPVAPMMHYSHTAPAAQLPALPHPAQPLATESTFQLSDSDHVDPLLCLQEQQGGFDEPFSALSASHFY